MSVCTASDNPAPAAEEEERWRRWVDDRFVRVITINIYRNGRESFQTFDYIAEHGNFSWPERQAARVVGALMMWALSGVAQHRLSALSRECCQATSSCTRHSVDNCFKTGLPLDTRLWYLDDLTSVLCMSLQFLCLKLTPNAMAVADSLSKPNTSRSHIVDLFLPEYLVGPLRRRQTEEEV